MMFFKIGARVDGGQLIEDGIVLRSDWPYGQKSTTFISIPD